MGSISSYAFPAADSDGPRFVESDISIFFRKTNRLICSEKIPYMAEDQNISVIFRNIRGIACFFFRKLRLDGIDGFGSLSKMYIHLQKLPITWRCSATGRWEIDKRLIDKDLLVQEYVFSILDHFRPASPLKRASKGLRISIAEVCAIAFKHWRSNMSWQINLRDLRYKDSIEGCEGNEIYEEIDPKDLVPSYVFYRAVQLTRTQAFGIIAQIWLKSAFLMPKETVFSFAQTTIAVSLDTPSIMKTLEYTWAEAGILESRLRKPEENERM